MTTLTPTEFQERLDKVMKLRHVINETRTKLDELHFTYKHELEILQASCTHDYVAEDDGDCHSPGYYYTCSICKHFTSRRPLKFRR